jgi:hypothetical protein
MAKQGCNEQKQDSRLPQLGNLAIDRITRLQSEVCGGKSCVALGRFYVLPREVSCSV